MSGWLSGWVSGWMGEWMDGWVGGWLSGWLVEWVDGWMQMFCSKTKNKKKLKYVGDGTSDKVNLKQYHQMTTSFFQEKAQTNRVNVLITRQRIAFPGIRLMYT